MHLDSPPAHGDFCVRSLSVPEVATDPGVSVNWVSGRIRRGVIRIDRDPDAGRFLFPDTDRTMRALRQLRTDAIARIAGPVFLPNGFVLAASLNRCRRRMPWTVLQSTSVRLGERCPSAVNCRAISQDRLRLLFAARPDRDPSILAGRHREVYVAQQRHRDAVRLVIVCCFTFLNFSFVGAGVLSLDHLWESRVDVRRRKPLWAPTPDQT